jgi:DDE superfamily endonuclease.
MVGFRQQHTVVYKTVSGESKTEGSSTVEVLRKVYVLKIVGGFEPKNMYNADESGLFFRLPSNRTLTFKGDSCNGGKNTRERITGLLACSAGGTDELPPLVAKKSESLLTLKMAESCPHEMYNYRRVLDAKSVP